MKLKRDTICSWKNIWPPNSAHTGLDYFQEKLLWSLHSHQRRALLFKRNKRSWCLLPASNVDFSTFTSLLPCSICVHNVPATTEMINVCCYFLFELSKTRRLGEICAHVVCQVLHNEILSCFMFMFIWYKPKENLYSMCRNDYQGWRFFLKTKKNFWLHPQ